MTRYVMTAAEVIVAMEMESVLARLDVLLNAENAKGIDKDNEKARFYAVARTHQQTALAYFEYWLSQRAMLARIATGEE